MFKYKGLFINIMIYPDDNEIFVDPLKLYLKIMNGMRKC